MKAALLNVPADINTSPLAVGEASRPSITPRNALIKVHVCGVCRTDLHVVEGELKSPVYPLIPGHQVVGTIEHIEENSVGLKVGDRVGLAWLQSTCGGCCYCQSGQENLCDQAIFTGWTAPGGYAEYVSAPIQFLYKLPQSYSDISVAPLLCAGIIGYRSLKLMQFDSWEGKRIGIYGFGNAGHINIQLLKASGAEVYVFTRQPLHQTLAEELGASWVGHTHNSPPHRLDAAVIYAPAGNIVPAALKAVDKGGRVICAGIHMSDIPSFEYHILYGERCIQSVTNNTREDGTEFLQKAEEVGIKTRTQTFPLEHINEALQALKGDQIKGAGVITIA